VDEAFAVVDVGAPNVDVLLENRRAAVTNDDGLALIPGLRSFQANKISIDADKLPADMAVPVLETQAAPADHGGVAVNLRATRITGAAIVTFRAADGSFIRAGSSGRLIGSGRTFLVGYDGQAFIEGLDEHNLVTIASSGKSCSAAFDFNEHRGEQFLEDSVTCRESH
jgi:outer membrane usher protein